jgi:hypothetical protein
MHSIYLAFLVIYAGFCIYGVCYNAVRHTQDGRWALTLPGGVTWILQLLGIVVVYLNHWSGWHLLWCAPLSTVAYVQLYRTFWLARPMR